MRRLALWMLCAVPLLISPSVCGGDDERHDHNHVWQSRVVVRDMTSQIAMFAGASAAIAGLRAYTRRKQRGQP